jgi:hypothetical protein
LEVKTWEEISMGLESSTIEKKEIER